MATTEDPPSAENTDENPATDGPPAEPEPEAVDLLAPKFEARTWHFEDDQREADYVQKPLSFVGKLEFFALIGETVDNAMQGANGLTIDGVISAASTSVSLFSNQTTTFGGSGTSLDAFMGGMARIARYAPDFLLDCYCIWLAVPMDDRQWVKWCMARNADEGGLTDDDAVEMMEVFIDQNGVAIRDFFVKRLPALNQRFQERLNPPDAQSPSSKRSSRTRRRTPKP